MEVPILIMIGPRRQSPNKPQLLAIEEAVLLRAKNGTGQIGGRRVVLGRRLGPERSTLYTRRDASFDVDYAGPLQKQQIGWERRILQRDERVEISAVAVIGLMPV